MKKLIAFGSGSFMMLLAAGLIFRFSPLLIPISAGDIDRQTFHSVTFYDRHGELLQEVLSQDRERSVQVSLKDVSPYFISAMVAAEDKNFYRHHGLDYGAILRALWHNLKERRVVSGASTITLQLARLLHPEKRTLLNKIKEAYRALRLEAGMTKNEILEAYVNRLPMGGNLYGVESAARSYLGISAAQLTLTQATFLAAIPNAPTRLNPYSNKEEIKSRQATILRRMLRRKMIPAGRVKDALKETLLLKPQSSSFLAPHFVFHLMKNLPDSVQRVTTTIDAQLQKMVASQMRAVLSRLQQYHVTNAAAILLDNHTGEVLAYVGSANFFNSQTQGQFDGVQALRQPGSTLKPFLYLLALEEGFTPATLISDIPTFYPMPRGIYVPKNYSEDFHGPVRLREALANSLNIPAVRTLAKIGTAAFLRRLRQYGFSSLTQDAAYYGVGLTLGGGEVSLFELTRAYMCLARMGHLIPAREILTLNDVAAPTPYSQKSIGDSISNYLIADMLKDHQARSGEFGFHSVLNLPFPCAVKTGTSFRFCDNWTVGFTRDYTLGVWVGNFDHSPMMKVSGVTGAGPLFAHIMLMLYNEHYPEDFAKPQGIRTVKICPLSGKNPSPDCPRVIEELLPERAYASFSSEACPMHVRAENSVQTVVPARFRPWAREVGVGVNEPSSEVRQSVRIVNPQDGAFYTRLSNVAPRFQSIRFQADFPSEVEQVEWYLNGRRIAVTKPLEVYLWQAHPGHFTLEARSPSGSASPTKVEFTVE